jgi:L1 cell adhesion molecule like protein
MVEESEKYKDEDELHKKTVDARNSLENYIYSLKNTLNDEKLKDKLQEEDKTVLEEKTKELLDWLDTNPDSDAETYNSKVKELEAVANPIMQKLYSSGPESPSVVPAEDADPVDPEINEMPIDELD